MSDIAMVRSEETQKTQIVRNEETQKAQIDPETAERFIAEKHIGERIKRLRLKKSMGLVELGKHTGLSASRISDKTASIASWARS